MAAGTSPEARPESEHPPPPSPSPPRGAGGTMRPSRAIVATLAVLAIAAPTAAAAPATIRVETVSRELVPDVGSGSVRSYVDTTGAAHVLAPRTALGQIVALAAKRDVPVTVQ